MTEKTETISLKREKNIIYELETFSSFCAYQLSNKFKMMMEFNLDEEDEKKQSFSVNGTFIFSKKDLFHYQKHFAKLDAFLKPRLKTTFGECYAYHSWSVVEKQLPPKRQRNEYASAAEFNKNHIRRVLTVYCKFLESFRTHRENSKMSIAALLKPFVEYIIQNYNNYYNTPGTLFSYRCNLLRFDYLLDAFFDSSYKAKRGSDLPDYIIHYIKSKIMESCPVITEFDIKKGILSFSTNIEIPNHSKKRKVEKVDEVINDES